MYYVKVVALSEGRDHEQFRFYDWFNEFLLYLTQTILSYETPFHFLVGVQQGHDQRLHRDEQGLFLVVVNAEGGSNGK